MLDLIDLLEAEAIQIIREGAAQCQAPVLLYSVGKDSAVLAHLARKAFYPAPIPFPLLHIDTGYKFPEMYAFRDRKVKEIGAELRVYRNEQAIAAGTNPFELGTERCCGQLKTQALLEGLKSGGFDAAFGGARRDEEKSRAKERVFSFRDRFGQWDPKDQRPELWSIYNGSLGRDESVRIFPLSNWTELSVWRYIDREQIELPSLYFAHERTVVVRGEQLIPVHNHTQVAKHERLEKIRCRFRTLGCIPCTGAIRSDADTVPKIIEELLTTKHSERITRIIDHTADDAMEAKKREGYF